MRSEKLSWIFSAVLISATSVGVVACGDDDDNGDGAMATGATAPPSAGDLCPNKTTSFEACVDGAVCTCNDGASYYSESETCDDDEYMGCEADKIGNVDEACEVANDYVDPPAECHSNDGLARVCREAGMTGPDTVQAAGCCTATMIRGCDLIERNDNTSMRD